ncbi:MAG: helix-turn-helix domain-containing protein [Planctomycetes bacterium]|nr:helix-turn-helix domain-containing protein [Planctomycetota bacterium]
MIRGRSLRALRESMGATALELADRAGCPVEILLRAEFGLSLPAGAERHRLAAAYRVPVEDYVRLALDEAERAAG